MTQLALDAEGMYASRAINRKVLFDAEGTERESIVIISNVFPEFCGC
jgi:hypothetical protein